MTQPFSIAHNTADWQLPDFTIQECGPRTHANALVIPVINEGDRIRGQLQKLKDCGLPIDIIVADGGSTDGSLDTNFIETMPIRAVLAKTGPGKLSAQLRMAYAFCLREGYKGIVTIDGNGKDGVEAIKDMVTKLEEGCDYVQGSRYLLGAVAENTPLERTIANRCIHAPLLSLAGRHWYTDTTNGFRAYSARYLLDPRVQPFRDVFQRYELLFYLTARAGQIGMKIAHVPVQRRYPLNAATPTKISGVSGKFDVLKQTFAAALGRFSPKK
jgi:glycosyltransferase involved in cell wall biosynthesis